MLSCNADHTSLHNTTKKHLAIIFFTLNYTITTTDIAIRANVNLMYLDIAMLVAYPLV